MVSGLRKIFRREEENAPPPFKQFNYLNMFPGDQLGDLLKLAEQKHFFSIIPDLSQKEALFISIPATRFFVETLVQKNPLSVLNYQTSQMPQPSLENVYSVMGDLKPLSVKKQSFDYV